MKKLSLETLKTGAKKAAVTTSLVLVLASALVPTAHAEVLADNIIGDFEVAEDRGEIKSNEMLSIMDKFYGCDKQGNAFVVTDDVRKAIELSDILNSYFYDPVAFTNTTANEIVSLDVNQLYAEYTAAKDSKVEQNVLDFCANNLPNKPAIDAFVTFGAGNVAADLKACVANKVFDQLLSNGANVTFGPIVIANNEEFYCLVEVNGTLKKIYLQGETCDNIRNICVYLENTYNLAINNIAGSEEHDLSFMYNGIDIATGESAWLALPDDDKKDLIRAGLNLVTELNVAENYTVTTSSANTTIALSTADKEQLAAYGIAKRNSAKLEYMNLTKNNNKKLTK